MKKKVLFTALASAAVLAGGAVYAQNNPENLIGFGFKGGRLNQVLVRATEYIGSCPGFQQNDIVAWFRDKEVPVAKDRRVRLTNLSLDGFSDKVPYSDREYEKKNKSEKIKFQFGDNHSKSRFIVRPGVNQFFYVIYEGDYDESDMEVIKEGEFSADFQRDIRQVDRDIQWRSTPRFGCLDAAGNFQQLTDINEIKKCPLPVSQKVGTCNSRTVYGDVKPVWSLDADFWLKD